MELAVALQRGSEFACRVHQVQVVAWFYRSAASPLVMAVPNCLSDTSSVVTIVDLASVVFSSQTGAFDVVLDARHP